MNTTLQRILSTFLILISIPIFSQEYLNKTEKYDLKIFEFIKKTTEKEKTSLNDYLENSKPFSKWDIRPTKHDKIWALDSIRTASEIPNFIWGAFSMQYKLSQREAMDKPNEFLQDGKNNKERNITQLKENSSKFSTLSAKILKSKNSIFLNQKSLQRIDNIYKENNLYWEYTIPNNSPFPISDTIKVIKNIKFDKSQVTILDMMKESGIYAAVKTKKGIFYLIDGFTDNSYGYYYNPKNQMENDNFLFEILKSEKITENYFYYIAN